MRTGSRKTRAKSTKSKRSKRQRLDDGEGEHATELQPEEQAKEQNEEEKEPKSTKKRSAKDNSSDDKLEEIQRIQKEIQEAMIMAQLDRTSGGASASLAKLRKKFGKNFDRKKLQLEQKFRSRMARDFFNVNRNLMRNNDSSPEAEKFDTLLEEVSSDNIDLVKSKITELNTHLCMSNESFKNAIKPPRFVKVLLQHLDNKFDSSLMLLASNCLLTMLDLFPEASESIIDQDGLKIIESKGQTIEYIDVAEDCIKLLNKIAEQCPNEVLNSNCASNFLTFIDFFDKNIQGVLLNLVKHFFNAGIWNNNIKQYANVLMTKCLEVEINEDQFCIKVLESTVKMLQAIDDMEYLGEHDEDEDDDGEVQMEEFDSKARAKVIEELIEDRMVSKWVKVLDEADINNTGNLFKAYTLIFKAIELSCKNSVKICVQVLKEDIIKVLTKWFPKSKAKKDGSMVGDSSDASDLEEFKVGSGGAATTAFHFIRKNSNARMNNLSNSQVSFCDNILHTILSVEFKKDEGELEESEHEYKKILSGKDVQSQLATIIIHHISISLDEMKSNNLRKQKPLQILEKIVLLLDADIITSHLNAYTISHQLRSILISNLRNINSFSNRLPDSSSSNITMIKNVIFDLLRKGSEHFSTAMIREGLFDVCQQYYKHLNPNYVSLSSKGNRDEKGECKLPSLTSSPNMYSRVNRNKQVDLKLPSITLFKDLNAVIRSNSNTDYLDMSKNQLRSENQQISDKLGYIVKVLGEANYTFDYLADLKQIGAVIKDEYASIDDCKKALTHLADMLSQHGITSYEIIESKILDSLHEFLIEKNTAGISNNGKSMWNRIHVFFTEIIDKPKVVHHLVDCLHKILNDEELIEDLHSNRFITHPDKVKIHLEYSSPIDGSTQPIVSTFMQSMADFEQEAPKQEGLVKKSEFSERAKQLDEFYKKTRRITLVVSNDVTLGRISKFIINNLKTQSNLDEYFMKRSDDIYIENHNYRDFTFPIRNETKPSSSIENKFINSMGLFRTFWGSRNDQAKNYNIEPINFESPDRSQNMSELEQRQNIGGQQRRQLDFGGLFSSGPINLSTENPCPIIEDSEEMEIMGDSDSDSDSEDKIEFIQPILPKDKPDTVISAVLTTFEKTEIDPQESVLDWMNNNIKKIKSQRTVSNLFSSGRLGEASTLTFTLVEEPKEDNEEGSEEDIQFTSTRSKRILDSKYNRTYSLFLQKEVQEKSLQDRELERLLSKDLQSGEAIKDQICDSSSILELLKLIYLLHQKNIRDFMTNEKDNYDRKFARSTLSQSKLKTLFVNSKVDSLLKTYLLSKHSSRNMTKRDEALVEMVQKFPMLYNFRTRTLFFKLTAFDDMRNRYFASELFTRSIPRGEGGVTISRRKIEIQREAVLDTGLAKIKDLQTESSFLEFQFENEVGTGLGPTLEFYALISKAIKEEPNMWKETSDNTLYPNPLNLKKKSVKQKRKIEKFFELVGTIIARSIMDERLIDLPISTVFWKLVFSETAVLEDLEKLDTMFYRGLKMIQDTIDKKEKEDEAMPLVPMQAENPTAFVNPEWICDYETPDKTKMNIEDLCLTFTLPGTENIELVRSGAKKSVSEENMKEYLRATLNSFFNDSVKTQVNAFRKGINNVFGVNALKCFLFDELEGLISGEDLASHKSLQKWNKKSLLENIVPDHGYTKDSESFLFFIEYMEGLDSEQIRNFLMFITGSPRLPLGGLKSLRPKLTVVKRTCPEFENPDYFLPSVMTCQNYVKLPEYSSLEVLKEKMDYAVKEGVNSFNLS